MWRLGVLTNPVREFIEVCGIGRLNIAKWLHNRFHFTVEEVKLNDNQIFYNACICGHLDVAKWFHDTFVITDEEVRIINNEIFRETCLGGHGGRGGHHHITTWLNQTFDLQLSPEQRNEYSEYL